MVLGEILSRYLPRSQKTPEGKVIAFIAWLFGAFIFACFIGGFVVFGVTMKGKPVVSVPDLTGQELAVAMEELQNYGLVAEVHQRNSRQKLKRGLVFSQHPRAGANMRMGGKVVVSVSRGLADLVVGNYVGKMLDDVKDSINHLNEISGGEEILKVQVSWIYSSAPANEVLAQSPDPGLRIDEPVEIALQVSQGKWEQTVTVPDLSGKTYNEAVALLAQKNIPFNFRYRKARWNETEGHVITQTPESGAKMKVGSFIDISVAGIASDDKEEKIFGVFDKKLPVYQTALNLSVYKKVPKMNKELFYQLNHPGGNVSIPYFEVEGTQFFIEVEGKEVATFKVQ